MECDRCKRMVRNELNKLGIHYKSISLGEVELKENISNEDLHLIDIALNKIGLELISEKRSHIIEEIKAAINELIFQSDDLPKQNFSDYITKKVNYNYTFISNYFSNTMGITIEKYIIQQRIERVKELFVSDKQNLSDIAYKLRYSSVAHLSNQFKKVTGISPSIFKQNYVFGSNELNFA
jgi:YesN/AraC family two-component response regulator